MESTWSTQSRRETLLRCGATAAETEELLVYNESHFALPALAPSIPLPDELFVETWRKYAEEADLNSSLDSVFTRFPQLNFAVQEGISNTPAYLAATRQGIYPKAGPAVSLKGCTLDLYPTLAGTIPVITAASRSQFVWMVQAFTKRNEPVSIPDSMGACFVSGYTNWDRVHTLRDAFRLKHPTARWDEAFQKMKADKTLYQDRFILLSKDAYSGVPAEVVGVAEDLWPAMSRTLRLEHECVHYFTRRVFGSIRNNVLDELIADYFGICALGRFRSEWLLQFWGLQDFPVYREGGRMQNYKGTLSLPAFRVLQQVVMEAVNRLQAFDDTLSCTDREPAWRAALLSALVQFPIDSMADESFPFVLRSMVGEACSPQALD